MPDTLFLSWSYSFSLYLSSYCEHKTIWALWFVLRKWRRCHRAMIILFFFGTGTNLECCLHTSFAGTPEEEHSVDDEISLRCSQFGGVLLSAFRDVFCRDCQVEACYVDLALRQTGRSWCSWHPALAVWVSCCRNGSERLGGCHCACELLFVKCQAALCPQALWLLWNPSCTKPTGQTPGHTW